MSMDRFTASILLGAAKNALGNEEQQNEVADLYKAIKGHEEPLDQTVADYLEPLLGRRCHIRLTSLNGVFKSLNNKTTGFYAGGRYPLIVSIEGEEYEYELNQVFFKAKDLEEAHYLSRSYLEKDRFQEYLELYKNYGVISSSDALGKAIDDEDELLLKYCELLEDIERSLTVKTS